MGIERNELSTWEKPSTTRKNSSTVRKAGDGGTLVGGAEGPMGFTIGCTPGCTASGFAVVFSTICCRVDPIERATPNLSNAARGKLPSTLIGMAMSSLAASGNPALRTNLNVSKQDAWNTCGLCSLGQWSLRWMVSSSNEESLLSLLSSRTTRRGCSSGFRPGLRRNLRPTAIDSMSTPRLANLRKAAAAIKHGLVNFFCEHRTNSQKNLACRSGLRTTYTDIAQKSLSITKNAQ